MEEKEIVLKVPQGKKAEWNEEGYLQLVDEEQEQPKDITKRVKTLYDARKVMEERAGNGDAKAKQLLTEYDAIDTSKASIDLVAFLKLRIICAALNEGWEPQFTEDEWRWYPLFLLWTEDELSEKSDEWKQARALRAINDRRTTYAGFASARSFLAPSSTEAYIGSRLCLKRKELADYCGHQFIDIWLDYCLPKK